MYIDKSIREYIEVVQSGDPTPGGGSVCSLVTSLAGALTLMTSNFSIDKEYFKELDKDIQESVKKSHKEIKKSIERLNEYIDEDAKGFASVLEAYKEEYKTEEEKQDKIGQAYKKALATPLKTSRECLNLLKFQEAIVKHGNEDTITDVGVGVILTYAALEGSIISVKINLNYIEDPVYKDKIRGEIKNIYKDSTKIKDKLTAKVKDILS